MMKIRNQRHFVILTAIIALLSACSLESIDIGNENNQVHPDNKASKSKPTASTPLETMDVHFIDIGQGDAIYIRTPKGDDILIDAGDRGKEDILLPYLKAQGVPEIDVLISTHPDADHMGSLDNVLEAMDVKSVYAPRVSHTTQVFEDFLLAVKAEGLKIKTAQAGVEIPLQDPNAKATFIAPVKEYGKDLNEWSAVLYLQYGENSYLFTGDAELESERDMIMSSSIKVADVDVLKVSHHGAENATSEEWLKVTKPEYAILSVGDNNRYDHPRQETLDRLAKAHAKVYRTDQQGSIVVSSDGQKISVRTER